MVPLICQALTASSTDDQVWLDSLRLLSNPKLRPAINVSSSIWLPLLLKALDSKRIEPVILAGLRLLREVVEAVEPLKSCLVKPLKLLGQNQEIGKSAELRTACEILGIVVVNTQMVEIGNPVSAVSLLSFSRVLYSHSSRFVLVRPFPLRIETEFPRPVITHFLPKSSPAIFPSSPYQCEKLGIDLSSPRPITTAGRGCRTYLNPL